MAGSRCGEAGLSAHRTPPFPVPPATSCHPQTNFRPPLSFVSDPSCEFIKVVRCNVTPPRRSGVKASHQMAFS